MRKSILFATMGLLSTVSSCDFISNAVSSPPTKIYSQEELKTNLQKLQKEGYKTEDDMQFWDILVNFSHSNIESNCSMFVIYDLVDAEDKNKLVNQTYSTSSGLFRKAYGIEVVDGNGAPVKDYTLFKDNLFKISELKQLNNIDTMMTQALSKVDKIDADNYISNLAIKCVPQITYEFGIKNKKDVSYKKYVKFDDNGVILK